ncbi:MAG: HdeD family acid-resistance protein, partial [Acidobacteriota bacterium]
SGWWLLFLVGLLSIVAGVIILFEPGDSLATLAVIAGIFALVNGILELIASFMRSTSNRGMVALFGVISAIVGVLLIRHPIAGVEFVAILLGLWLITVGLIRFATAFDEYDHRFWYGLAGVLAMIAGIVILVNPNIGYATLALLVGMVVCFRRVWLLRGDSGRFLFC